MEKNTYVSKIFWMGLRTSVSFAVPAIIAVIVGIWLDSIYGTGRKITAIILIFSFIFSWIMVIVKYRRLNETIKKVNKSIKENDSVIQNKKN